jgi:hypothetical protein
MNELTDYTKVIPLEQCGTTTDPRKKPQASKNIYKLKLKTMDIEPTSYTSYSNSLDSPTKLRDTPAIIPLEADQPLWDPREQSFMDLLLSNVTPDEILEQLQLPAKQPEAVKPMVLPEITSDKMYKELETLLEQQHEKEKAESDLIKDYSEFDRMLSEQTFIDKQVDITELRSILQPEARSEASITNIDDFITLSIDDLADEDTWLTLDSLGCTTPLDKIQVPINFMDI